MSRLIIVRIDDDRNLSDLLEAYRVWEQRGRGWRLWDFAVELEPPFRRMHQETKPVVIATDDARVRGGVSGFFRRNRPPGATSQHVASSHLPSTVVIVPAIKPRPFYRTSPLTEIQLVLPRDLDITNGVSEQFASSLISSPTPLAFEIFADVDEISIQMACDAGYEAHLTSQLKAFFPVLSISKRQNFLVAQFDGRAATVVADFGLSRSFLLPLRTFRSFNPDPLAGLINSFASLRDGEKALFQVLAQPARHEWVEELQRIQSNPDMRKALQEREPSFSSSLREKLSSPLFTATLRVIVAARDKNRCWEIVKQVGGALGQFADPSANELIALSNDNYSDTNHRLSVLSRTSYRSGMLLNTSELASFLHMPGSSIKIDKLKRDGGRTKAIPAFATGHRLILGQNLHEGTLRSATLSNDQRTRHIHVLGSTGSGKSTWLLDVICQDIEAGEGVCVIDPHGDLIDNVCARIPENRIDDVILFDPSDSEYPIGFNILQAHSDLEKTLISSDLVAAFKRLATSWGDVMDAVLANAVLAILESDRGGTLFDLKRFLVEKAFRNEFLTSVKDESVRYFWLNEFPLIAGKPQSSILIRLDTFLRQKMIRNIVCQKENKLNLRSIMDGRKILLIKLTQGAIGFENSSLLGSLLVAKIHQIAISRQDTANRPFFGIFADEFQNVVVPSVEGVMSGIRKFNIGLVVCHQEYRQLQTRSPEVAASVMSNCYTRICFRLGDADAERFAAGFSSFDAAALQNLGVGEAIARIERADYDFNLKVVLPPRVDDRVAGARMSRIIALSRERYATPRQQVEIEMFTASPTVEPPVEVRPEPTVADAAAPTPVNLNPVQVVSDSEKPNGHRYLQSLIKRIGENYEFVSTIEKEVFGGTGRIDVSLENSQIKIACEIAVTNTVAYETGNIQKCISAGYDRVVVISSHAKHLRDIKRASESFLTADQSDQVHFLEPENFHLFLESLQLETSTSEQSAPQKVKGYRVESTFAQSHKHETEAVRDRTIEVLLGATKKEAGGTG